MIQLELNSIRAGRPVSGTRGETLLIPSVSPSEHVPILNCRVVAEGSHSAFSEHICYLICRSYEGKQVIWSEFGVSCKHKANMHMLNSAITNHLHCPSEQKAIPAHACCIVEKDGKPDALQQLFVKIEKEMRQ